MVSIKHIIIIRKGETIYQIKKFNNVIVRLGRTELTRPISLHSNIISVKSDFVYAGISEFLGIVYKIVLSHYDIEKNPLNC